MRGISLPPTGGSATSTDTSTFTLPGQAYAHTFASSGAGTESSPYTSTDGTAGIGGALASLSRGGRVTLSASRFALTATPVIATTGTWLSSTAPGFNVDPNGEAEGVTGSKIRAASGVNGLSVQNGTGSAPRQQGVGIERLYLYGAGANGYSGTSGITVGSYCDQLKLSDLNISGFGTAIKVLNGGSLDHPYFTRLNILGCTFGVMFDFGANYIDYAKFTDCCFADLDAQGVIILSTAVGSADGSNHGFVDCTFVHCARTHADANDCAAYITTGSNVFSGCVVHDTGHNVVASTYNSAADGFRISGNRNIVTGCKFTQNTKGTAVHITAGSGNVIRGNVYHGNLGDITIDSGATDTIIDERQQGLNIVDNGTRTIINGVSNNAGDPDTTGAWNGVAKPAGLILRDTVNGITYFYPFGGSRVTL